MEYGFYTEGRNMIKMLNALIGSQAHGLAGPDSDYDYRGVFVTPTEELLSLGQTTSQTSWVEGKEDDVSWEVARFLFLATKCNPSILEVFKSPQIQFLTPYGYDLIELFPYVWNSKGVHDAFCGYGFNQRKKFLDERGDRRSKYAVAYLRTLYNAHELLTTGNFYLSVTESYIEGTCRAWRRGEFEIGEVISVTREWEEKVHAAYAANPDKQTDMEPINRLLLQIRRAFWRAESPNHITSVYEVK
jgi:uncharacterized protein